MLLRNEIQIQDNFSVRDPKCCPWQHFGSVACSVACSVADGGKKLACKTKYPRIPFFLRWVEEILHHLYKLTFANA